MDYKDIFRPDTLARLNKRSQENLKKMMGDKTLMQTMMSSTRLLQEIMKIEAPYKDQLEQLAIQMVEDMYPIINEDGINIDAKIVSMGDVNRSLDEIKINKPFYTFEDLKKLFFISDDMTHPKSKEYTKELERIGLFNGLNWKLPNEVNNKEYQKFLKWIDDSGYGGRIEFK